MDLRDLIGGRRGGRGRGGAFNGDLRTKISSRGGIFGRARTARAGSGIDLRSRLSSRADDDLLLYRDFDAIDDRIDEYEDLPIAPRDARLLLSRKRAGLAEELDDDGLDEGMLMRDARTTISLRRAGARMENFGMRIANDSARDNLLNQVTRLAASTGGARKRTALRADFDEDDDDEDNQFIKKRALTTKVTAVRPTKVIITNEKAKMLQTANLPTSTAKKNLSSAMQQRMQKKEAPKQVAVLITGLAESITEHDVQELCETIDGYIKSKMIDKGVAQATFATLEQATDMIDQYDGRDFDDSEMHIHILGDHDSNSTIGQKALPIKKAVTSAAADTSSMEVMDDDDPTDLSLPAQKRRANNESQKKSKINLSNDVVTSALHNRASKGNVEFTIRMS